MHRGGARLAALGKLPGDETSNYCALGPPPLCRMSAAPLLLVRLESLVPAFVHAIERMSANSWTGPSQERAAASFVEVLRPVIVALDEMKVKYDAEIQALRQENAHLQARLAASSPASPASSDAPLSPSSPPERPRKSRTAVNRERVHGVLKVLPQCNPQQPAAAAEQPSVQRRSPEALATILDSKPLRRELAAHDLFIAWQATGGTPPDALVALLYERTNYPKANTVTELLKEYLESLRRCVMMTANDRQKLQKVKEALKLSAEPITAANVAAAQDALVFLAKCRARGEKKQYETVYSTPVKDIVAALERLDSNLSLYSAPPAPAAEGAARVSVPPAVGPSAAAPHPRPSAPAPSSASASASAPEPASASAPPSAAAPTPAPATASAPRNTRTRKRKDAQ